MIVERIRALCRDRGTNIKQVELALGFGNGTISKWESASPTVVRLKAVADYFGIKVDDLIKEEN